MEDADNFKKNIQNKYDVQYDWKSNTWENNDSCKL